MRPDGTSGGGRRRMSPDRKINGEGDYRASLSLLTLN